MHLARTTIATPIGDMLALAGDDGLCFLEFIEVKRRRQTAASKERLSRLQARLRRWFPPHDIADEDSAVFARTRAWLTGYFAGEAADPGGLPIDMHGAPFEKRVWQALLEIPAGETMSYGGIAKKLGNAGASRAVGAANGANPISIIVPCHRVIGSSGSLTGYGGGLDRKTWLLDHERRWRNDQLF